MIKPHGCGSTLDPCFNPESEIVAWLTLHYAPRLGPRTVKKLLGQFHSATAILENINQIANKSLRKALANTNQQVIEKDLNWLAASPEHHIIYLTHPDYPALLKTIPDPPLLLFVAGDPLSLSMPQLGIVGSRNPTAGGLDTAHDFAFELAKNGLATCSGLALGVDGAAHMGALHAEAQTVAVIGSGLDVIYPARHARLANRIKNQGAMVSEFAPGTAPLAAHFPRRNRIISGLSVGILVIEAARRSGSLITARLAAEQGREVFAIPGSIHNPLVRGNHRLIKCGANLVETSQDIINGLGSLLGVLATQLEPSNQAVPGAKPVPLAEPLMAYIDYDPVDFDALIARSGLTAEHVSAMLSSLEIQGCIVALPGGRYCRS